MPPQQPFWPRHWLMTDPRLGDRLFAAIEALPPGGGVVLRHDALPLAARRALGERVAAQAAARGLVLAVAGDVALAAALGAALVHRPMGDAGALPISLPVHDEQQADEAARRGAALVFVSPLFATRSHPGQPAVGVARAVALAQRSGRTAIALGGMTAARFAALPDGRFHGWAGIDAWLDGGSG